MADMVDYTHLHVHSEYSLLDGIASASRLVNTCQELGQTALAITDHGVMFGVVGFYKAAKAAGINPILGCEAYVARNSRHDRTSGRQSQSYHLTLLAKNNTGYGNLMKLVSLAQLEGFYYRPRLDRELLEKYHEGLIVLSGCPSAEVARKIQEGDDAAARATVAWYRDIFGPENYFIEIQEHDIAEHRDLTRKLVALSQEFDLKLVATNDVHYARPDDAYAQEILLCIQTNTTVNDPNRMKYGETFYMKSGDEMARLFPEFPQALQNTQLIAEMCDIKIEFGKYHLPIFEVPTGDTPDTYLRKLCEKGLERHYSTVTPDLQTRLDHELNIIHQMGFDTYFLIVWDLTRFARENGIWWNVRGSAAGALVAYTLGITILDPLSHGLIFERFLNPGRVTMPDIDLDFPDDQRDKMIQYTMHKYGSDKVAQIITFGTMGARAALRDAGRALDLPLPEVDKVTRLVPAVPGKPVTLSNVLDPSHEFFVREFKEIYEEKDYIHKLIDTAQQLEGVARHASTHAAGVVVTDIPIVEYCPLHRPTRGEGNALPVTQFPMEIVESIGLLKIDFLGLATLTIMRRAAELIEKYHGAKLTLETIPVNDGDIFKLLSRGDVTGIFQVEGAGMRRVLIEMQPTTFEDIIAVISLYRPGPLEYIPTYINRKHGREPVTYRHPMLEPILKETYGIIVYQEQIIHIASQLAGYSPGEADTIRKAVSKKKREDLIKHREKFVTGALARNISQEVSEGIFDDIEYFARYGFNKAHAADYAVITCQTAYLKAHYPVEYMTAMLSVERGDTAKLAQAIADCYRMGVAVRQPDVNVSQLDFTIEEQDGKRAIRFGMAAVKNVGDGAVQAILDARGIIPFANLDDFCQRVDLRQVNRRGLECLIKVGAFDGFGRRPQILAVVERMLAYSGQKHQAASLGQMSLFDLGDGNQTHVSTFDPLPAGEDIPYKEQLMWEKELLGLYVSQHPLYGLTESLEERVTALCGDIAEEMAGQLVTVAGMISGIRTITTRKGDLMAFVQIEDLQGNLEVTVFPRIYEENRELWREDNLVIIRGKVDVRQGKVSVLCDSIEEYKVEDGRVKVDPKLAMKATSSLSVQEDTIPFIPAPTPHKPAEPVKEIAASQGEGSATDETSEKRDDPGVPAMVTVSVPRSGDERMDIQRLSEIYNLLQQYPGNDRFSMVVPMGEQMVEIAFPNNRVGYNIRLKTLLQEIVGSENVYVQRQAEPEPLWKQRRSNGHAA
ncbi:MAG: DNA polymerase III subunit alpha [Chloroflexi bacterium]|nr:DNA polymerase III subunit alpha [Chloroflexota bacterium]